MLVKTGVWLSMVCRVGRAGKTVLEMWRDETRQVGWGHCFAPHVNTPLVHSSKRVWSLFSAHLYCRSRRAGTVIFVLYDNIPLTFSLHFPFPSHFLLTCQDDLRTEIESQKSLFSHELLFLPHDFVPPSFLSDYISKLSHRIY